MPGTAGNQGASAPQSYEAADLLLLRDCRQGRFARREAGSQGCRGDRQNLDFESSQRSKTGGNGCKSALGRKKLPNFVSFLGPW